MYEQFTIPSSLGTPLKDTTTPVLLVLYEVEARGRLGDASGAEAALETAVALPHAEPRMFETISCEENMASKLQYS